MQVTVSKAKSAQPAGLETQARISVLEAENQSLKQQLDWFAYSTETCHPFHVKAATQTGAKLPPIGA